MLNRLFSASLIISLGLASTAQSASGQALVPHVLQLDPARLERQGLALAQEAAQLAQFQQFDLALPRVKLASQLAPKRSEVWSLLGALYLQNGDVDQGITTLKQAQALDGKNTTVLFSLGSAYFQKQQYQTAIEYLEAGLKLKPNVTGALFDLGNAYLMLRQYPTAIAQYEKAFAQDKTFWPALTNIGLVKYETGEVPVAIQQWRKASAIDPKAAEPQLALAVALYVRGDREQGWKLGEAAIQIDSRYSDLKFLKENLWGDRLLADAKQFLETPRMKETIAQAQGSSSSQQSPASRQPAVQPMPSPR